MADGRPSWALRIRSLLGWPTLIALGFMVGAATLVVSGHERFPYTIGSDLSRPVYSRVAFTRINQSKTDELRKVQQQKVPDSYRLNRVPLRYCTPIYAVPLRRAIKRVRIAPI